MSEHDDDVEDVKFCAICSPATTSSSTSATMSSRSTPLVSHSIDIPVINFNAFKALTSFPRYPDNKDIIADLSSIDRGNSLIIFISHFWIQGLEGAKSQPDNATQDKFKLCVEGIDMILTYLTASPGSMQCYVWLDCGCLNILHQDSGGLDNGSVTKELKQLVEIVKYSDCIFTPIFHPTTANTSTNTGNVEEGAEDKEGSNKVVNVFHRLSSYEDYFGCSEGLHRYLGRMWCRLEMMCAAAIPVVFDKDRALNCFRGILQSEILINGNRPHFIYSKSDRMPMLLPHKNITHYNSKLDPLKGELSISSDQKKIEDFLNHMREIYYKTTMRYSNGNVYEGALTEDGKQFGKGIMRYASGDVYEGDFVDDKRTGKGVYKYKSSGNIYEGDFVDGKRTGTGVYRYSTGAEYKGDFIDGKMTGKGVFKNANGNVFVGDFKDGHFRGKPFNRFTLWAFFITLFALAYKFFFG